MLPENGEFGMSKSMAEMMLDEEINSNVDEVILVMKNGEVEDVKTNSY